jgi:hypothetical protein
MAYNYSDWPTKDNATALLLGMGVALSAAMPADYIEGKLDAIVTRIENETNRQFIADTDSTSRYYDGYGTAVLNVDDMVALDKITIIGMRDTLPYDMSGAVLAQADHGNSKNKIVSGRGSEPALAGSGSAWLNGFIFPEGRQNIIVTGRFGYAETIPADLWMAVLNSIAVELIQERTYVAGIAKSPDGSPSPTEAAKGRVSQEKFGDEEYRYDTSEKSSAMGHLTHWNPNGSGGLDALIRKYKARANRIHKTARRMM